MKACGRDATEGRSWETGKMENKGRRLMAGAPEDDLQQDERVDSSERQVKNETKGSQEQSEAAASN